MNASNQMTLRNTVRRLSQKSNVAFNTNQPLTIIVTGALLLLAGFSIVRFLLNFDQLERLAEENDGRVVRAPVVGEISPAIGSSDVAPAPDAEEPKYAAAWLGPLNRYRAMVGLASVTADPRLSRGDLLHVHYLTLNYAPQLPDLHLGADAHTEDPSRLGFTVEGAAAARASDVDWIWDPSSGPEPSWAINNWMQVPFHRMQISNPYLERVGYGTDCQGAVCFAALNTGTDVDPPSTALSRWRQPLFFPPDGSVMDSGEYSGEWPDPLTSCPGYKPPAGLPITLELGHLIEPGISDYSVTGGSAEPIEACAIEANSYVNPDAEAKATARAILRNFGAIIIVPRRPLSPGRYLVALTAGERYSWSFSVASQNRK
jgi:hypothetical protein